MFKFPKKCRPLPSEKKFAKNSKVSSLQIRDDVEPECAEEHVGDRANPEDGVHGRQVGGPRQGSLRGLDNHAASAWENRGSSLKNIII